MFTIFRSQRYKLDLGIIFSSAALIALVSLLIEDCTGAETQAHWIAIRLLLALITSIILATLYSRREQLNAKHGTIYHVQYVAETMPDLHEESFNSDIPESMDARRVMRRMPYKDDNNFHDLASDIDELHNDLQRAMNSDITSTGFHLAPNMLYPASLGFGYQLYAWPNMTLREYPDLIKNDTDLVQDWKIPTTWEIDERIKPRIPDIISANADKNNIRSVLLIIEMTQGSKKEHIDIDQWAQHLNVDVTRHVGVFDGKDLLPVRIDNSNKKKDETVTLTPEASASAAALAIRHTLHHYPDATIYLGCRLTKTVAVATGWLLRESYARKSLKECTCSCNKCSSKHCNQCTDPWTRLVPIMGEPPHYKTPVKCKVNNRQPL